MKRLVGAVLPVLLLLTPEAVLGQEDDARVLPPGVVRLEFATWDARADAVFGPGGTTRGLGGVAGLAGSLTFSTFAPLGSTVSALGDLLAGTGGLPPAVSPLDLFGGDLEVDVATNTRSIPLRVAVGLLPRVEVGARLPLQRSETISRRLMLTGGNVGLNPDTAGNAEVLLGLTGERLGRQRLLPVAGTALADTLQRRVAGATGSTLTLPGSALTAVELFDLGVPLPARQVTLWQPGDLEIDARVRVVDTFGEDPYPTRGGVGIRLAFDGRVRFPTGVAPEPGFFGAPPVAQSRMAVGATADVFIGERFWTSGGVTYHRLLGGRGSAGEVDGQPSQPITGAPGLADGGLDAWATPRARLTRELSLGGSLRAERWTGGPGGEGTDSRDWLGVSLRYTSLPAHLEGRARLPLEFTVGLLRAVRGSVGVPAERVAYLRLSLEPRLWGGAAPRPTGIDSAPAPAEPAGPDPGVRR